MRELSLFTGAGGGLLGTRLLGWEPIGYVEWEPYCQQVIAARIADGHLPAAPIFGDVREFVQSGAAREYRGFAGVVTGGFPCQPFSVAGKRAAADDPRNMWPATRDVVSDVRPPHVFLENVPGLVSSGYFGTVVGGLSELGYCVRWGVVSAADCGAPHIRSRLWVIGSHANSDGSQREWAPSRGTWRKQQFERLVQETLRLGVPRRTRSGVSDGLAHRMDRLKALGNGQVPAVVASAWRALA